ncbi:MAG: hypothetical protein M0P14_06960 [Alkaliphilus sp.]|nr:hypothetical protein [Alkaliphilus sp.]
METDSRGKRDKTYIKQLEAVLMKTLESCERCDGTGIWYWQHPMGGVTERRECAHCKPILEVLGFKEE